ncbi:MAG TPA: PAS domain S-box protein, partial [Chitinispirillaceae bacterium]|nr:PAS domain S-box protein [Chitinispirillaceae bacterium]
ANNPFHVGDGERFDQYCSTVIQTQKELLVSDATSYPHWNKNSDIKLGIKAYLGYPINYPDKTPFGTLCVLDNKIDSFASNHKNLIKQFSSVFEMDLTLLKYQLKAEQSCKELKESRHQYQTLADSGPVLIWKSGVSKKCEYFNQSWLSFTGRTIEQELGDGWKMGVHPDDLKCCIDIYTKAFDQQEKFSMIHRLRDAKGEYRWIQNNGKPRYDSKGTFIGYIGNCLDVTNVKETEEKMRESELLIRAIMDNLPIGISVNSFDPGVNFIYMNDNFSKTYRTSPEALYAPDSFWDEVYEDPDFRKTIKKRVLDDCASGDPKRMHWENIPISHNGQVEAYISAQNIPIPGKKLMVSLVWDVTERKKADELMKQNEQRYRTIVESAPDAVFVQTEKKFVYLNSHAVKLFGAKNEAELLGQPVLDRFYPDLHKPVLDKIELLNDERQPIKDVIAQKYRRIDGSEIWVEIAGFPIVFEGKNSALVLLRDITERKKAEDALAEEKERLSVTLRSIGDGVITTDIDGNIVLMNKVAEELTGWKQDDAAGKELSTVFKIINESTRKPHENPVQKVLSTGKVIELANHTVLISRNGTERVIADSG